MNFSNTFLIAPAFLTFLVYASAAPAACPFSKQDLTCTCVGNYPASSTNFQSVTCKVGNVDTLPKFNSTSGAYSISGQLLIEFEHPIAFYILADSFVDFSSVGQLNLISDNDVMSISWDENALRGVRISNFTITNIFHFNSAFAALHADTGTLQILSMDQGGAYHLGGGDLQPFQQLKCFTISETSISTIDPTAFAGLEHVIEDITLTDADVTEAIFPAVQPLQSLKNLNLSGNDFKSIDLAALDGASQLGHLVLDRSETLTAVSISHVQKVPANLNKISITASNFKSIDSKFASIMDRPAFQLLDISNSNRLTCDQSVQWMDKYALCNPIRLNVNGCKCANSQQTLQDYLTQTFSGPCK